MSDLEVIDGKVHLLGELQEAANTVMALPFFEGQTREVAVKRAVEQCHIQKSNVKTCAAMTLWWMYGTQYPQYCPCAWILAGLHDISITEMTPEILETLLAYYRDKP